MGAGAGAMQFGPPQDTGMYDYPTPPGYADTFFVYVYDAFAASLVTGKSYVGQKIPVTDGAFVCRAWNGAYSVLSQVPGSLGTIQIYEKNLAKWFDNVTNCYTPNPTMQAAAVLPEKIYDVDSAIVFDLNNVNVRAV
jgi:hypothetical protein